MNSGFIVSTLSICKLKARLFVNTFRNWATPSKTIGSIFGLFITMIVMSNIVVEELEGLAALAIPTELIEWILGIIALYMVVIVFCCDLFNGHTINAGQMSSDFDYLLTLPVSPLSLILVKIFERCISDYIGFTILLSGLIGITCRQEFTFSSVFASILIYMQISLLMGCLINLLMIFLKRIISISAINNLFSVSGYILVLVSILPFIVFKNFSDYIFQLSFNYQDYLQNPIFIALKPIKWLGSFLLGAEFNQGFWYFTYSWAACIAASMLLFYILIRTNYISSNFSQTVKKSLRKPAFFSGLIRKDYLLIKSDFNILINTLLMPVTLIALNIYLLSSKFPIGISQNIILNIIFGSIIYFCMFGPCNAIGAEGQAITLLETMPISPNKLIKNKFYFWFTMAAVCFVAITVVVMAYLGFTTSIIISSILSTLFFTGGCVWVSIQLAAIFARYNSKILQQSSTFTAKVLILLSTLLIVPIKSFSWLNLYNLIIFIVMATLLNMNARAALFFRNEGNCNSNSNLQRLLQQRRINFWLISCAIIGGEVAIRQFFLEVIPGENTGLWSWIISASLVTTIALTFYPGKYIRIQQSKSEIEVSANNKQILLPLLTGVTSAILSYIYILHNPSIKKFLSDELFYYIAMISKLTSNQTLSLIAVTGFAVVVFATISLFISEQLLTKHKNNGILKNFISLLTIPLLSPAPLIPVAIFAAFMLRVLSPKTISSAIIFALSSVLPPLFYCANII